MLAPLTYCWCLAFRLGSRSRTENSTRAPGMNEKATKTKRQTTRLRKMSRAVSIVFCSQKVVGSGWLRALIEPPLVKPLSEEVPSPRKTGAAWVKLVL